MATVDERVEPASHSAAGQAVLGEKGLIVLLIFLTSCIPLSTDLYLPALPQMTRHFNSSIGTVNLTLGLFFIANALGTLLWGPLSDRYGRKPILLTGLAIYTLSTIACALSANIETLIASRIIQGVGSGVGMALANAIAKDSFGGKRLDRVLVITQSLLGITPIVAPVIGAFLLNYTDWRGSFRLLSILGIMSLAGAALFRETHRHRAEGNPLRSFGGLYHAIRNPGLNSLLLVFSLRIVPLMAFISASSYIYIQEFGMSEQTYSYFFALNAIFMLLGPLLYPVASRMMKTTSLIMLSMIVPALCGTLIHFFGAGSPWIFALLLLSATFSFSIVMPPATRLMLEQQTENIGAVSSLIACMVPVFGSVGTIIASLDWSSRISVIGLMHVGFYAVSLLVWLTAARIHARGLGTHGAMV